LLCRVLFDVASCSLSLAYAKSFQLPLRQGERPQSFNGWSICPIRAAEKLLNETVTAQMGRWLLAGSAGDFSEKVYQTGNMSGQEVMAAGASSFSGFPVDPRGPDTTAFNWALTVFKARMREASKELAKRGFSREAPPPFLSPDYFSAPAPDGFLVQAPLY